MLSLNIQKQDDQVVHVVETSKYLCDLLLFVRSQYQHLPELMFSIICIKW